MIFLRVHGVGQDRRAEGQAAVAHEVWARAGVVKILLDAVGLGHEEKVDGGHSPASLARGTFNGRFDQRHNIAAVVIIPV